MGFLAFPETPYSPPYIEPPDPEPEEVTALRTTINANIATLIDGKTPAEGMPLFTTCDHATATYVRNPDCILHGLQGVEASSVWNSTTWQSGLSAIRRPTIAITPHVLMFAWHTDGVGEGKTVRFVRDDNTVVERIIAPLPGAMSGYEQYTGRIRIGGTDIGLSAVTEAMPVDFQYQKFFPLLDPNILSLAASGDETLCLMQQGGALEHPDKLASIGRLNSYWNPAKSRVTLPDWWEGIYSGDSGFRSGIPLDGAFILTRWAVAKNVAAINQAIADLGHPDESVAVVSLE